MNQQTESREKLKKIVATGMFAAFAYICCVLFHFRVSFLSFELKDAVMAVGAMSLGPVSGAAMVLIVCCVELATIGSTGLYGFIMNLLSSMTYICVSSCIYRFRRTMRGAVAGMICASIATVAIMLVANCLITPFYMHCERADVVAMIPTLLAPFNVTKTVFNSAVVFLLYKPVTNALARTGFLQKREVAYTSSMGKDRRRILVPMIAGLAAIVCLCYFFLVLHGNVTLR